jgi:hypothetical protein
MYTTMNNDISWLIWLAVSVLVAWLIIYTAVRAGVGHALDRAEPRLVADTHVTPTGVEFVVSNLGLGPAFDVSVRWLDRAAGDALVRTPMLGRNGTLAWTVPVGPVPDERQSVLSLKVDWGNHLDPSVGRHSTTLAVLVPSRLDAVR